MAAGRLPLQRAVDYPLATSLAERHLKDSTASQWEAVILRRPRSQSHSGSGFGFNRLEARSQCVGKLRVVDVPRLLGRESHELA